MAKIFLSYSRKDSKAMQRVKSCLEQAGVSVWTDEGLRPGTPDWQIAIEREIEACKGMVVLLSKASCQSVWVRREINRANRLGRLVIPVFIETTPQSSIPLLLENTQYIDASSNFSIGVSSLLVELHKQGWVDSEKELRSPHASEAETEKQQANSRGEGIPVFSSLINLPRWVLYVGGFALLIVFVYWFVYWSGNVLRGYMNEFKTPEPLTTTSITEVATMTDKPRPTQIKTALLPTDTAIIEPIITPSPTTEALPRLMTDDYGVPMAFVPAGLFQMGSDGESDNEKPEHAVYIDSYWIDETEVTNEKFASFLSEVGNQVEGGVTWLNTKDGDVLIAMNGDVWQPKSGFADHPVIEVSWYGARAYCEWVGGRLPTEAEWEKAARGGLEGELYPWGDEDPVCTPGAENGAQYVSCDGSTVPVKTFSPNGYGLYDMAGNVWEWVADWYDGDYYVKSPENNPTGPEEGSARMLRGGSWGRNVYSLRAAYRYAYGPSYTGDGDIGFRCARDATP